MSTTVLRRSRRLAKKANPALDGDCKVVKAPVVAPAAPRPRQRKVKEPAPAAPRRSRRLAKKVAREGEFSYYFQYHFGTAEARALQAQRKKHLDAMASAVPWSYDGIMYMRNPQNEVWHQGEDGGCSCWVGYYLPEADRIFWDEHEIQAFKAKRALEAQSP